MNNQNPSVGGFLGNALSDVENIGSGLLALPGAVSTAFKNPQQGGQMLGNAVKSTAEEYNNLVGQPVSAQGNLQLPNIGEAVSHAYQHPVNTALDVLPFIKPLQALGVAGKAAAGVGDVGKTAEEASILAPAAQAAKTTAKAAGDVSDARANMFLHGYTIPRQVASDVNPLNTAKQIISDGHSGTPSQLAQKFEPITGANGVIENIKRHILSAAPTNIDLSSALKVTGNMQKTVPELAANPARAQVYSSQLRNMLPANQTAGAAANALDAYDSMKAIRSQGYDYIAQGEDAFGKTINAEKVNVGKQFLNAAQNIRDEINNNVQDNNLVDQFKTPAIQKTLQSFSPKFADRYMNDTHNFSDLQGLQAPYLKMGQIIKQTMNAGNTAASNVGKNLTKLLSTGAGAAIGGGLGGPVGAGVGSALGALSSPFVEAGVNSVLPKITSGIAKNLPKITSAGNIAKTSIKLGLPLIGAQGSTVGVSPMSQTPSNLQQYNANNNKSNPHASSLTPSVPKVNNVPQSQNQITFDQNGHVGVFNPFNGTDGITKAQYQNSLANYNSKISGLQTQMAQNPRNFNIQKSDASQIDALNTQKETLSALNAKSRSLDAPYRSALDLSSMSNQATDDIKNGWSNISLANGSLNTLATLQNGKYSKLASALGKLQDDSGVTIFQPGMSLDVALGNLQQAVATQMYNSYYSNFPSVGGYPSASSPAGVPTNTAPQATNTLPSIGPSGGQMTTTQAFTPPAYIQQNLSLNP